MKILYKAMNEKKIFIGFYDYTVILTYVGMISAFIGILNTINYNFKIAIICLMFTGLCDMFDGTVASTKKRNKQEIHFGIQIDSFCDLISFGVFPALFIYMYSEKTILSSIIAIIYTLLALIRLSVFNVIEEERKENTNEKSSQFLGIPVTTVALLLPLMYLLYSFGIIKNMILFSIILLILGIFFITTIKIQKPNLIGKIIIILIGISEIIGLFLLK